MFHTQQLRTVPAASTGPAATEPLYIENALRLMLRPSSQREPAHWSVTIDADNMRLLFSARYFIAGVLIGAAVLLPVFLAMA